MYRPPPSRWRHGRRRMNLLQALDDRNLFQPLLRRRSWGPWKTFLRALFALPMGDDDLDLYRRHTERLDRTHEAVQRSRASDRPARREELNARPDRDLFRLFQRLYPPPRCGRARDDRGHRRRPETGPCDFQVHHRPLDSVPMLRAMVEDRTAEAISLSNRVTIEIHTASFRVTRGYTFAAVLADETAFWRNEDSTNPDVEIFRALRPGLANIPGAMLLNASSPYRRTGVLHEAYRPALRSATTAALWSGRRQH